MALIVGVDGVDVCLVMYSYKKATGQCINATDVLSYLRLNVNGYLCFCCPLTTRHLPSPFSPATFTTSFALSSTKTKRICHDLYSPETFWVFPTLSAPLQHRHLGQERVDAAKLKRRHRAEER
jgi:hypothetical protein